MTLARQMYPNNPQQLLRRFEDAIQRPYGYLLVDLKPTTPESWRMRTNVLESIRDPIPEPALTRSLERTNEQSEAIPMYVLRRLWDRFIGHSSLTKARQSVVPDETKQGGERR